MSEPTVILITGPNRGLGKNLLESFLARGNHTVIAAVREPSSAASKALLDIKAGAKSSLVVVKIDSNTFSDPATAVEELKNKHNVSHIDIVIANAGIAKFYGAAIDTPVDEMRDHFMVNALAPLALFQATAALLRVSKEPKFFVISTNLASLGLMEYIPMPGLAYGCSKAAANYICRKIHFECTWLTAVALAPGWVQTDMGQYAATALGAPGAPTTVNESIAGLVKQVITPQQIDQASRTEFSGKFVSFDDSPLQW